LLEVCQKDVVNDDDVMNLSTKLAESANIDKSQDILDVLPSCIAKFTKYIGGRLCSAPPHFVSTYEEIFQAVVKEPTFCEKAGGKTKLTAAVKAFIVAANGVTRYQIDVENLRPALHNQSSGRDLQVLLNKCLASMEQRPKEVVLKDGAKFGPVLQALQEAEEKIVEFGDDLTTDSEDMLARAAVGVKDYYIDMMRERVRTTLPGCHGGVAEKYWHDGINPNDPNLANELAQIVPPRFAKLDNEAHEILMNENVKAPSLGGSSPIEPCNTLLAFPSSPHMLDVHVFFRAKCYQQVHSLIVYLANVRKLDSYMYVANSISHCLMKHYDGRACDAKVCILKWSACKVGSIGIVFR
jgi:hypothetical protein